MITCILKGGIGNMLFQIASSYSLAVDNNDGFYLNLQRHIGTLHTAPSLYKNTIFRNLNTKDINPAITYTYDLMEYRKIPYHPNAVLDGYFQSEKYFDHRRNDVLKLFQATEGIQKYINDKYSNILVDSVSIHVRRGNYLSFSNVHPQQSIEYYTNAVNTLGRKNILVFSDDINWCKSVFPSNYHFIEEGDENSLYLMSLCNDNIICNSSYSWWGAWLNNNSNKRVISPKRWFGEGGPGGWQDVYCKDWITL